jgi:hypothetical protein
MHTHTRLWSGIVVTIGLLQAWDSGGFASGPAVAALVVSGLGAAAAPIAFSSKAELRIGGLVLGFALLTWARIIAPAALNGLHLSLFAAALYVLASGSLQRRGDDVRAA